MPSSKNSAAVLEAAGIAQLFDTRVDGNDIQRLKLKGKPAPDAFSEGARRLKVEPSRAVVMEDAIAGVEAARAGEFGCVIGVHLGGHSQELRKVGADFGHQFGAGFRLQPSLLQRGAWCTKASIPPGRASAKRCAPSGMVISLREPPCRGR